MICVTISLLIAFVLFPVANSLSGSGVSVVRAKQDIPAGTKITGAMLETVNLGRLNLPSDAAADISEVTGKYAAVDITQYDIMTPAKTAASGGIFNLGNGQCLISITIRNFADGLSGKLQSGDIVSVHVPSSGSSSGSIAGNSDASAKCPPELRYVKVAAVTASTGKDTNAEQLQTEKSSGTDGSSDSLPATVTLLVNEKQADVLSGLDKNEIHLALECRGNSKKAKAMLDAQNIYLESHLQESSSSSTGQSSASSSSSLAVSSSAAPVQTGTVSQ